MATASIVWVDLCASSTEPSAAHVLQAAPYRVTCVKEVGRLPAAIAAAMPKVLCIEYDYPDLTSLCVLRDIKRHFQRVPILMLTAMHSEDLAVWAFRNGARDYLVKPIERGDLCARLDAMIALADAKRGADAHLRTAWQSPVPAAFRCGSRREKVTQCVIAYIEAHYHESVYLETVARLCGLGRSRFSRVFKAEQGETFSRYLNRYRVARAMQLLRRRGASVIEVAFAVGFANPSYFTHSFRRYSGMLPSDYRKRVEGGPAPAQGSGGPLAMTWQESTTDRGLSW